MSLEGETIAGGAANLELQAATGGAANLDGEAIAGGAANLEGERAELAADDGAFDEARGVPDDDDDTPAKENGTGSAYVPSSDFRAA